MYALRIAMKITEWQALCEQVANLREEAFFIPRIFLWFEIVSILLGPEFYKQRGWKRHRWFCRLVVISSICMKLQLLFVVGLFVCARVLFARNWNWIEIDASEREREERPTVNRFAPHARPSLRAERARNKTLYAFVYVDHGHEWNSMSVCREQKLWDNCGFRGGAQKCSARILWCVRVASCTRPSISHTHNCKRKDHRF